MTSGFAQRQKVYVELRYYDTTRADLRNLFAPYGEIVDFYFSHNPPSNWVIITMATVEAAKAIVDTFETRPEILAKVKHLEFARRPRQKRHRSPSPPPVQKKRPRPSPTAAAPEVVLPQYVLHVKDPNGSVIDTFPMDPTMYWQFLVPFLNEIRIRTLLTQAGH